MELPCSAVFCDARGEDRRGRGLPAAARGWQAPLARWAGCCLVLLGTAACAGKYPPPLVFPADAGLSGSLLAPGPSSQLQPFPGAAPAPPAAGEGLTAAPATVASSTEEAAPAAAAEPLLPAGAQPEAPQELAAGAALDDDVPQIEDDVAEPQREPAGAAAPEAEVPEPVAPPAPSPAAPKRAEQAPAPAAPSGEAAQPERAAPRPGSQPAPRTPAEAPSELSDKELLKRLAEQPASLGPLSVGRPSAGALVNGTQMPAGQLWTLVDPTHAWGTQETIGSLVRAIAKAHQAFPGGHKLRVGHISAQGGGPLNPHKSHQSGRDVDTSYYYRGPKFHWYSKANAQNLDVAKTWAFVRALLTETDVQLVLINTSVQKILKEHALAIGEDPAWLDSVFQYRHRGAGGPLIIHVPGHDTHIHVRFFNPVAQELGRRSFAFLVKRKVIKPKLYYQSYTAKKGDTLGHLAQRFKTTVEEIQKANQLTGTKIYAQRTYRIPREGQVQAPAKLLLPPRRLPPADMPQPARLTAAAGTTSSAGSAAP